MTPPRPPLRPLDDALAELLAQARPLAGHARRVATFDADGRVLAEDLVSPLQVPPQDNSSMDGYAVRSAEIADEGVPLPVSQRIPAGAAAQPLQPGTAARIFTGAPMPRGRRRDRDAGGQPRPLATGACASMRVPAAASGSAAAARTCTRGARGAGARHAPAPAALGLAASIGRDRAAGRARGRAWRCSPPATNS